MNFSIMGRIAGAVVLSIGLAGCIDVTADIEVLSDTTAKATTNMTMGAEFYPMLKAMAEADPDAASEGFCTEAGAELSENPDGSATCTIVGEGSFADIVAAEGPTEDAIFTVVSPGVVRVAFKTENMASDVTEGQDEESMQMLRTYFDGHNVTMRIRGKRIVETNMDLEGDTLAEKIIPFSALFDGSANLPDELFAVVDTR